jgi:hypothetical protein
VTADVLAEAPGVVAEHPRDASLRGVRDPVRVASIPWA